MAAINRSVTEPEMATPDNTIAIGYPTKRPKMSARPNSDKAFDNLGSGENAFIAARRTAAAMSPAAANAM
jgi:hypothetical protein